MSPSDSASLSLWEAISFWGMILVWIGVAVEGAEVAALCWKLWRRRRLDVIWTTFPEPQGHWQVDAVGAVGWLILVIGLSMEVAGHKHVQRLTKAENRRLTKQLDLTTRQAGEAIKQAAQANENAANIELEAEQLRTQNLKLAEDLEKLISPRYVTFNGGAFANALKDNPKMDVQIWHYPEDAESLSLINYELVPALNGAGWKITEIRPFVPEHSSQFSSPFSVKVGLNINPVDILVSEDIFWETVGLVMNRDDIKTAPKAISKAFEASGICWGPVSPIVYFGASPIPTNTIRIIVFPKKL